MNKSDEQKTYTTNLRGKTVNQDGERLKSVPYISYYSAQASNFAVFVESGTRKLRKVVESKTKFTFDVERVLDSTTVLVLDSTPTLLL